MKTLMVDMDDVLLKGNFLAVIEEFLGKKIDINTVKTYYLQDLVPDNKRDLFWEFVKDKEFYKGYDLLDGAYEVLEKLSKKYDIYIATSFIWEGSSIDLSGNLLKEKYYFLKEKLPFIKPDKYIFASNKNLFHFDIKIDDRPKNLENASKLILFDAWHNRNLPNESKYIRVYNWQEIYNLLK